MTAYGISAELLLGWGQRSKLCELVCLNACLFANNDQIISNKWVKKCSPILGTLALSDFLLFSIPHIVFPPKLLAIVNRNTGKLYYADYKINYCQEVSLVNWTDFLIFLSA